MLNDLIDEIDKQIALLDDEVTLALIALFVVAVWVRVMFIKRRREPVLGAERPSAVSKPDGLDLTTQLARLRRLHDDGALDDDEYKAAKAKLLSEDGGAA